MGGGSLHKALSGLGIAGTAREAKPSKTSTKQLREPGGGSGFREEIHRDQEMPLKHQSPSDQPWLGPLSGLSDV